MPNKTETLPDGSWIADGELGEHFTGTPDKIIPTLLDSQQNTKKELQRERQKREELERQLAAAATPPPPPVADDLMKTADWLADTLALKFAPGLTGNQLVAKLNANEEVLGKINLNNATATFHAKCPDFPNSPEAIRALIDRVQTEYEIPDFDVYAAQNPGKAATCLVGSHRGLIAEGVYKPLDTEEQRLAASDQAAIQQQRGTPPPMIRSTSPDNQGKQPNEWDMPLADLRANVIRQQLGQK